MLGFEGADSRRLFVAEARDRPDHGCEDRLRRADAARRRRDRALPPVRPHERDQRAAQRYPRERRRSRRRRRGACDARYERSRRGARVGAAHGRGEPVATSPANRAIANQRRPIPQSAHQRGRGRRPSEGRIARRGRRSRALRQALRTGFSLPAGARAAGRHRSAGPASRRRRARAVRADANLGPTGHGLGRHRDLADRCRAAGQGFCERHGDAAATPHRPRDPRRAERRHDRSRQRERRRVPVGTTALHARRRCAEVRDFLVVDR